MLEMICFLILHYVDVQLTVRAVNSILHFYGEEEIQIVIVDNASPNESGNWISRKYKNIVNISVLCLAENLGFSAGNNVGFQYIKEHFNPQFVIVMNNDILYVQEDFLSKLKRIYEINPFWVAGPDIYVPQRDYHASPMYSNVRKKEDVILKILRDGEEIQRYQKNISLHTLKMYVRDCFSENALLKKFYKLRRIFVGNDKEWRKEKSAIVLQGACIIFDRRYCEINDMLFTPLTFMYAEEDFLTLRCMRNKWEIRYVPEIQVWHTCQGSLKSSKMSYRQYCKKQIDNFRMSQESFKMYLNYLDRIEDAD